MLETENVFGTFLSEIKSGWGWGGGGGGYGYD